MYTDVRYYYKDKSNNSGYIDFMPTYNIIRASNGFSLIRAGVGLGHDSNDANVRIVSEFKNIWTVNDRLELEGNMYYTNETRNDGTINEQMIYEAYIYFNQPLYTFNNGVKLTFLAEGGVDPYSFGERVTGGKESEEFRDKETYEDNYFYAQATVRATIPMNEESNVWVEGGYYAEEVNGKNNSNSDDDGAFIQMGFETKL